MISDPASFRRDLYRWFARDGRKLPWRGHADPYAVLVSEFMLQQTTVAAVIPFFRRWMETFPTPAALAAAEEGYVLKCWEGLGYYSRARNLQKAAQAVVREHGGRVPGDLETLRRLPGVGPYTAAAVAAFAFDRCVPVVDANILRVLARLINFREPVQTARARETIDAAAVALLPKSGGARHTSALMDLGATVCRSGEPSCASCPVRRHCLAVTPAELPVKAPKPVILQETDHRGWALRRGRLCLVKSEGPRWKGLWLLPPARSNGIPLVTLNYVVTRHRIRLELFETPPDPEWTAFAWEALPAMPTPHRKAVEAVRGQTGVLL